MKKLSIVVVAIMLAGCVVAWAGQKTIYVDFSSVLLAEKAAEAESHGMKNYSVGITGSDITNFERQRIIQQYLDKGYSPIWETYNDEGVMLYAPEEGDK